jgi:hypothetical protein
MQGRDMALTEEIIGEKAKHLGGQLNVPDNFGYSAGWLHNFKKRYHIKSYVLHGEAGSANQEGIDLARSNFRELLEGGEYEADDVYNQDESGAFWRQMPHAPWPQASALAATRRRSMQRSHCVPTPQAATRWSCL